MTLQHRKNKIGNESPSSYSPLPFKAITSCSNETVRMHVLEFNPDRVRPAISVQHNWDRSRGIIRGVKEHGSLVEDFIAEVLDDEGRLADAGRRIVGADEMRRQVWTVDEHQANYLHDHPDECILAWTGNGNLFSNPHFVAGVDGHLFHLCGEERWWSKDIYSCLAVWRDQHRRRVSIESLDLSSPLPRDLDCFTTGQRLVEAGRPIATEELVALAQKGHFYDLRHLFLFGRIPRGDKRWIDVGLAAFWRDGELDTVTLERAVRGGPIAVDICQFEKQEVRDAMRGKDYVEVGEPKIPGQFAVDGSTMKVIFLEGLYPHNMVGVREDGTVLCVVFHGLSNRVGLTIRGAAELMKRLGAQDALLIDNGGDVMLSFDGKMVLGSAEGERNRLRSILLFRHSQGVCPGPLDVRLITYPKQICLPLVSRAGSVGADS